MSNHDGSYLLNDVLHLLEERGVFKRMGRKATQQLVLDIEQLSRDYDCNPGEILEEIGQRLGICRWCLTAQKDLVEGVCLSCRQREGWT